MFDIFGNGKAWARDLGECAHTNEAKLYGLRFRRQLRGDCFQGNSPATDVRQNFGSCGLAATEREFRPNVLRQMMAARGIIADARSGKNGRHALAGLFRQSVFSRLVGYEDVNDAERLRHDPAMRWIVGGKAAQEERGFAESDGALRDAMARGARELRCSCRPGWPVDRPCARPKATPWHRARHGFKREPARPTASRR